MSCILNYGHVNWPDRLRSNGARAQHDRCFRENGYRL
jgi:hypothetical protein